MIIRPHLNLNIPVLSNNITGSYELSMGLLPHFDDLISNRLQVTEFTARDIDCDISMRIDPYRNCSGRALIMAADAVRIRAGGDDEVIFQVLRVTMVRQVNPRIDIPVSDLRIVRNAGSPEPRVAANKIIAFARKLIKPGHLNSSALPAQFHAQPGNSSRMERRR